MTIELNLKNHLIDFKNNINDIFLKYELYGKEDVSDTLESLEIIVSSMEENDDYFLPLIEHKIDQYGLSETAVKLANSGMDIKTISLTVSAISGMGITEDELKEWYKNYSVLKHTRKTKVYGNLFNVQERMQEIYENLLDHLDLIKETPKEEFFKGKTTREQVTLEVLKDVRTITKDAKEILKTINHYQKLEEFKSLVIETIRSIDPTTARVIIEKLEQDKALFNALLPPK
jgi:hypothetical protein